MNVRNTVLTLLIGWTLILLGCPDEGDDDIQGDDDTTAGDDDSSVGDDDSTPPDDDDAGGDDDTSTDDDSAGDDDTTGDDDDTAGMTLCNAEAPMYVHAHDELLAFQPTSPYNATSIAPFSRAGITDLAIDDMDCMYAISLNGFYVVDAATAQLSQVSTLPENCNSLAALSSGDLALGCGENIYLLDPLSGTATLWAQIPGWSFEGDLYEMPGGDLLLLAYGVGPFTWLLSFDPLSGQVTPLGSTGHPNVYGLGSYDGVLFAFVNDGLVLELDPLTGASTVLALHSCAYTGTATR